jgi:hypothetical protein
MAKRDRIQARHTCDWCKETRPRKVERVTVHYGNGTTARMRVCDPCKANADDYSRLT